MYRRRRKRCGEVYTDDGVERGGVEKGRKRGDICEGDEEGLDFTKRKREREVCGDGEKWGGEEKGRKGEGIFVKGRKRDMISRVEAGREGGGNGGRERGEVRKMEEKEKRDISEGE